MEQNKLIQRFAEVQGITYEEAEQTIGAPTDEEILKNIEKVTLDIINAKNNLQLNRAQRRKLKKKMGKNFNAAEEVKDVAADTMKKLGYIDLIQKLRALNAKNEKENEENEKTN